MPPSDSPGGVLGALVPRGDEDQPRLHHTWATTEEYITKFGHLSYMWRTYGRAGEEFSTDYDWNARVGLQDDGNLGFTDVRETPALDLPLNIMIECGFRMYPFVWDNGVLRYRFDQELREMQQGTLRHPCRDLLVDLYNAKSHEEDDEALRRLRSHEVAKIEGALKKLREHLEAAGLRAA
jgi:hypothetical protein